jgi:hypothetical protein
MSHCDLESLACVQTLLRMTDFRVSGQGSGQSVQRFVDFRRCIVQEGLALESSTRTRIDEPLITSEGGRSLAVA